MNNLNTFTSDARFLEMSELNKDAILKLDKALCAEGYIFNGNWRNDRSSGGCNASFEIINSSSDRKNLVTLKPMKNYLKVEVYWGFSQNLPLGKKSKVYFPIDISSEIPAGLLKEVRDLYNHYF